MISPSTKSRLLAGSVHLGLSALIASAAAALIFLVWYPSPMAAALGVGSLVLILIGVDVTMGPVITTIVYDRAKKSLRFDLAVVGLLQLAALLYGLHTIFAGRPVYLVFNVDRFDLVAASDVDIASLQKALSDGKDGLPLWGPRTVAVRAPQDAAERNNVLMASVNGGPDLPQLPAYFVPYADERETVVKRMRPLSELREVNHLDDASWQVLLTRLARAESELRYLPMRAKVKDGAVVVDAASAEIIDILLLEPRWD